MVRAGRSRDRLSAVPRGEVRLRDGPAVGLERDVVRLGAAAHTGVEHVQVFELGGGELEVEHVEGLGYPFGPH